MVQRSCKIIHRLVRIIEQIKWWTVDDLSSPLLVQSFLFSPQWSINNKGKPRELHKYTIKRRLLYAMYIMKLKCYYHMARSTISRSTIIPTEVNCHNFRNVNTVVSLSYRIHHSSYTNAILYFPSIYVFFSFLFF